METMVEATDPRASGLAAVYRELATMGIRMPAVAEALHPGLSCFSYAVLVDLLETGSVQASVVARHFGLDKSTVSRHLATLREDGLITRERARDARAQVVMLTPEGRRVAEASLERLQREMCLRLSDFTPDEVESLGGMLRRYNAAA